LDVSGQTGRFGGKRIGPHIYVELDAGTEDRRRALAGRGSAARLFQEFHEIGDRPEDDVLPILYNLLGAFQSLLLLRENLAIEQGRDHLQGSGVHIDLPYGGHRRGGNSGEARVEGFDEQRGWGWARGRFGELTRTVVVGGAFLLTLLIVSIITVRVSDMILDSRVGALDRTLGFVFGLARGLVIVVVAFLFFSWLVPERGQPDWVREAKSRVVLQGTGQWLMSMLPDDPESTILKRLKRPKGDDPEPPPEPQREQRSEREGYERSDRAGMQQLIDGRTRTR